MKPMLAQTYDGEHRITYPCYVQPKFNGVRALYQNGRFQSREEIPWQYSVLAHIAEELKKIIPEGVVLDGELYRHGWPLQRINGAVAINRTSPNEDTPLIQYMIFDVVDHNLPFEKRFELAPTGVSYAAATTMRLQSPHDVNDFYSMMVNEGFEGIMYRLGDCPYTLPNHPQEDLRWVVPNHRIRSLSDKNNRTWHLLKRKAWQDGEFICVQVEEGIGKRQNAVGAFVCLTPDGRRFRVGSGISDTEAYYYLATPEAVLGHKIKVKFLTLTREGIPFNPTIEAIL